MSDEIIPLLETQGVRVIPGTSDNPASLTLQMSAARYAERYNKLLLDHLRKVRPSDGVRRISKETVISIAAAEARQYWYEPHDLIIDADETNSAWETFLAELQKHEPSALREPLVADLLSKLAGKTYWAVKLSPRATADVDVFDGTTWIFVDADSGAVLSVLGNSVRRPGG